MPMRLGAYVLPGDPVWMRSSLARYYHRLDDLVVAVPSDGLGWTGRRIPVQECLAIIAEVDERGIARYVEGTWTDPEQPMRADTAQRQAALDALGDAVDWVLQIDNDEVIPDVDRLIEVAHQAGEGTTAIEWPMRVLYRHVGGTSYLSVAASDGRPVHDYPGPVLIRPEATLVNARRPAGAAILRATVIGDDVSLPVRHAPQAGETRRECLDPSDAIVHNSWGRSPSEVWRKTRTWGHASGLRGVLYFGARWYPSRWAWRWQRDLHPFARGLWPRLRPETVAADLLDPADVPPTGRPSGLV